MLGEGLEKVQLQRKPAIFIDSGSLVDTSLEVLGGENWALAGGDGWVRGKGSNGSSTMLREGLEKVELQRKQDGKESSPRMTHI